MDRMIPFRVLVSGASICLVGICFSIYVLTKEDGAGHAIVHSKAERSGELLNSNQIQTAPAQNTKNSGSRDEFRAFLFTLATEKGIREAYREINQVQDPVEKADLREWLAKDFLRQDFAKLKDVLECIRNKKEREKILDLTIKTGVRLHRSIAIQVIDSQLDKDEKNRAHYLAVCEMVDEADFDSARALQRKMQPSYFMDEAIGHIALRSPVTELDHTLDWLKTLSPSDRSRATPMVAAAMEDAQDVSAMQTVLPFFVDHKDANRHRIIEDIVSLANRKGDTSGLKDFFATLDDEERVSAVKLLELKRAQANSLPSRATPDLH